MISQNIRSLRTRQRMTQEDLAQRINVVKWESGDAIPDLDNACRLAEVLNVGLDALIHHDEAQAGYPILPRGLRLFGVVRMGERGQIVIPKRARDVFDLHPGSELLMLGDESQGIALQRVEDAVALLEGFGRAISEKLPD